MYKIIKITPVPIHNNESVFTLINKYYISLPSYR